MTDRAAELMVQAQLLAQLDKLQEKSTRLYLEMHGFDRHVLVIRELIQHPPPHTDPDAYWRHIAGRITETSETLDKIRALLPPEMRVVE